jgi:Rrf2 family protein
MKRSNRFSLALHVLVHLAERPDEPLTSEHLAACVRTNPVVVRRALAGLRQAGLVASAAGHRGGWMLARAADAITLRDVYAALGERLLFAIDVGGGNPDCRIRHAVAGTLDDFLHDAEALLAARLSRMTLAEVASRAGASGHGTHTEG